jgi:hypothetical protein
MNKALLLGAGAALAIAVAGCISYRVGRLNEAIDSSWVPKEHVMLAGSMQRIEQALSQGETGAVVRAVAAYNARARAATNEYDYYLAALAFSEQATNKP